MNEIRKNNEGGLPLDLGIGFEMLTSEEKLKRITLLTEGLANSKEQEINITECILALACPEKLAEIGAYKESYESEIQLPFSKNKLALKITVKRDIYFKIKDDMDWLRWDGSKHNYTVLITNGFKQINKWQRDKEIQLIDKHIETVYNLSHFYFKNISDKG